MGESKLATFMSPRQRVPMLSAAALEGRTRPALDGSAAARLRYFRWSKWRPRLRRYEIYAPQPSQARLGRR